jgi:hypothetical protein
MIAWNDFELIAIRVEKIIEVKIFEKVRKPAYQI